MVPILPLIDILTILLIFFVVTSQFKKKRRVFELTMPTMNHGETEMTLKDHAVVEITKDGTFSVNAVRVEAEQLEILVSAFLEKHPRASFEIVASEQSLLKDNIFVLDTLAKYGAKEVYQGVKKQGDKE